MPQMFHEVLPLSDLIKHVLKDYKTVYPEIMLRAARTFDQVCSARHDQRPVVPLISDLPTASPLQVFGLKLVEIDPKNHLYILVNKMEPAEAASPVL